MSLINNQSDIGAVLKELGSSGTIKSLATSMLTAGLSAGIGQAFPDLIPQTGVGADFDAGKLFQASLVRNAIAASVDTAINGGNLVENLALGALDAAISTIGAAMATEIGTAAAKGDINRAVQLVAHAAVGCSLAAAGSAARGGDAGKSCAGGAIGAAVGETAAGQWLERQLLAGNVDAIWQRQDAIDFAQLSGAFAALLVGADVNAAANAAQNSARYNAVGRALASAIKLAGKILINGVKKGRLSLKDIQKAGLDEILSAIEDGRTLLDPNASLADKALAVLSLGTGIGKKELEWLGNTVQKIRGSNADQKYLTAAQLIARNRKLGMEFEKAVLDYLKLNKNKQAFTVTLPDGRKVVTIPDAVCGGTVLECKNVTKLYKTRQLEAQIELAKNDPRFDGFTLVISHRTQYVSQSLVELIKGVKGGQIMRFDPVRKEMVPVRIENGRVIPQ